MHAGQGNPNSVTEGTATLDSGRLLQGQQRQHSKPVEDYVGDDGRTEPAAMPGEEDDQA